MLGGWFLQEHVAWFTGSGEVFSNTCEENLAGRGGNMSGQGVQDKER